MRLAFPVFWTCLWGLLVTILCARAAAGDEGTYHAVQGGAEGRYIPWATSLDEGPIEVLFIAPRATLHDVAALRQRFDFREETVVLWDGQFAGCDPELAHLLPDAARKEAVLERLGRLLEKKPDVIVLGNFAPGALPEDHQRAIAARVEAGTGLVMMAAWPDDSWLHREFDALPLEPLGGRIAFGAGPLLAGQDAAPAEWLDTRVLGEGRVVRVSFPGDRPAHHFLAPVPRDPLLNWDGFCENALSLAARCIRWAARRDAQGLIAGVHDLGPRGPDADTIPPSIMKEFVEAMRMPAQKNFLRPFIIALSDAAPRDYTVHTLVRRPHTRLLERVEQPTALPKGARWVRVDLPAGPGAYTVDVWLSTHRGVADWFTRRFEIPGWPSFSNLRLSKNHLLPNDAVEVTCMVPAILRRDAACTVHARGVDSLGRLVSDASAVVDERGGVVTLRLGFSDLLAPLVRVEVYAVEGAPGLMDERLLQRSYREIVYLPVRRGTSRRPGMVAGVGGLGEANQGFLLRALADAGVDAVHTPGGVTAIVETASARVGLVPEIMRVTPASIDAGHVRNPCLEDPDYRQRSRGWLQEGVLRHLAGSSQLFSLGWGACLTPTDEPVCGSAWCAGKSPQEMKVTFTDFMSFARDETHTLAPETRVGFVALPCETASTGYDWALLGASMDFVAAPPRGLALRMLRASGGPARWHGVVADPATRDPRYWGWLPWWAALCQTPTVWFPVADRRDLPLLRADGLRSERLESLAAAKASVALASEVLARSTRAPSGIALFVPHEDGGPGSMAEHMLERLGRLGYDPSVCTNLEGVGEAAVLALDAEQATAREAALRAYLDNGGRLLLGEGDTPFQDAENTFQVTDASDDALAAWLAEAGCRPVARDRDGAALRLQGSAAAFEYGAGHIQAFMGDWRGEKQRLKMAVTKDAHVYNMVTGEASPSRRGVSFTLEAGTGAFFCALPYEVTGLDVLTPDVTAAGQRLSVVVRVRGEGEEAMGKHLVRVRLIQPDGKPLRHYEELLECLGGVGECYFALALDETPGQYRIEARDGLTGLVGETRARVVSRRVQVVH